MIQSDPRIGLLENPEYKRRWADKWSVELREALEEAILDRLEDPELWRDYQGPVRVPWPSWRTCCATTRSLLELAACSPATPSRTVAVIGSLRRRGGAVPGGVPVRAPGLEKYREWQRVWELQRREDAGENVDDPGAAEVRDGDFPRVEYWKARGKLDVPKERFMLYPGVCARGRHEPVLGWAGWDHRDQALALAREMLNQQALGASTRRWCRWLLGWSSWSRGCTSGTPSSNRRSASSAARAVTGQIDQFLARLQMTRDDVNAWRRRRQHAGDARGLDSPAGRSRCDRRT